MQDLKLLFIILIVIFIAICIAAAAAAKHTPATEPVMIDPRYAAAAVLADLVRPQVVDTSHQQPTSVLADTPQPPKSAFKRTKKSARVEFADTRRERYFDKATRNILMETIAPA